VCGVCGCVEQGVGRTCLQTCPFVLWPKHTNPDGLQLHHTFRKSPQTNAGERTGGGWVHNLCTRAGNVPPKETQSPTPCWLALQPFSALHQVMAVSCRLPLPGLPLPPVLLLACSALSPNQASVHSTFLHQREPPCVCPAAAVTHFGCCRTSTCATGADQVILGAGRISNNAWQVVIQDQGTRPEWGGMLCCMGLPVQCSIVGV